MSLPTTVLLASITDSRGFFAIRVSSFSPLSPLYWNSNRLVRDSIANANAFDLFAVFVVVGETTDTLTALLVAELPLHGPIDNNF